MFLNKENKATGKQFTGKGVRRQSKVAFAPLKQTVVTDFKRRSSTIIPTGTDGDIPMGIMFSLWSIPKYINSFAMSNSFKQYEEHTKAFQLWRVGG